MGIHVDMIGLVVSDIAASLRFYRLLGLDVPADSGGEPYVDVITPNGYRISWNSVEMVRELDPDWEEPRGQRMSLAFKCSSAGEVDAVFATIVAAGYTGHKAPWDAFWGQRYAVVVDPDGNKVDIFAPLG
jgi:uncharacterized glyoxalase superfamily protein PhnB